MNLNVMRYWFNNQYGDPRGPRDYTRVEFRYAIRRGLRLLGYRDADTDSDQVDRVTNDLLDTGIAQQLVRGYRVHYQLPYAGYIEP